MKNGIYLRLLITALLFLAGSFALTAQPVSKAVTSEKQASLTPKQALKHLKAGNERFINGELRQYDYAKEMKITTKKGQHPIGIILSCIDSRSIPDILFDQGLGNLFVSRIAGNVADKEILGSMEFATKIAGAPLVIVMGHTHCGAIQGACATDGNTGLNNLDYLLSKIKPAVQTVKAEDKTINCDNYANIDLIAKQNVVDQLHYIKQQSSAINTLIKQDKLKLLGAMHDISTGKVSFFDEEGKML